MSCLKKENQKNLESFFLEKEQTSDAGIIYRSGSHCETKICKVKSDLKQLPYNKLY